MKFSYARLEQIATVLVTSANEIPAASLANRLDVTDRTIRSDIRALNAELKEYHLSIVNSRGKGYRLKADSADGCADALLPLKEALQNSAAELILETTEDRVGALLYQLLTADSAISLDEEMNRLFIGWNTMTSYLDRLRRLIAAYDLKLIRRDNRIRLVGDEDAKRQCLIDQVNTRDYANYVLGFSQRERAIFEGIDLDRLAERTSGFLDGLGVPISDYNRKNVIIHVALTVCRIMGDHAIEQFDGEVMLDERSRDRLHALFAWLEEVFAIGISRAERRYLAHHIALNVPSIVLSGQRVDEGYIRQGVLLFLDRIRENYSFDLSRDQQMVESLVAHFKSVIGISELSSTRKNPLLDVIISTFPLAYEMTATSADVVESWLHLKLTPDEASFVTLHIGASMERLYAARSEKRRAALVCGSGTATAVLLKAKIESRFSSYLDIVGTYPYADYREGRIGDADFIISTIPLIDSPIPVIQIDLTNFLDDSRQLHEFLTSNNSESEVLASLFDRELTFVRSSFAAKNEALDFLCSELRKRDVVDEHFKGRLLAREELYSTAIGGSIAIPHPLRFSSKVSRVAFMSLERPLVWDDRGNEISYIFMLAISKADYVKIQPLFGFLVELQNDSKFDAKMRRCEGAREAVEMLRAYLKELGYEYHLAKSTRS
ncbi:transcriptional antiterminator, BglG [Coriobacterium glomerans PW2]|uniref:Transcriptional antiterminator, BglG n=1 Tax=Coriobacterium glomerans (strain ATCC 49209 / DSM 20642 / JCM 10262 / PW2) TaxID=700015 RepID=F2NB38_CORGP|nr:PTS sugar transporter subunit IIA [Coriobacterium glomerans]AEB07789.1 transcriptional antiterminator, BglG [Coriobacterium glomerans PW2]